MDKTEMLQDLIGKGFFPRELVPAFTTQSLASIAVTDIIPSIVQFNRLCKTSVYGRHSIARVGHSRRILAIPNPIHQIKLFQTIVENWEVIENHINLSDLSLSKPIYNKDSKRAFSRARELADISVERVLRSIHSHYLLKIDISKFYASIYTHSIPWALHSKVEAKRNRNDRQLLGNILDSDVRVMQDGQTVGIPTGPDSSLIISEIIGSAIDAEINVKVKGIRDGFRYMDDYFLFFGSKAEAETALSEVRLILGGYELEMNADKSKIISLPEILEPQWVSDLRLHQISSDSVEEECKHIISYFSKAFEYHKRFPDEYVLVYALNKNKRLLVNLDNWPLFESIILNIILNCPTSIKVAVSIFENYRKYGYENDVRRVSLTINEIILHHSRLNQGREVCWALWLAMVMNVSIHDSTVDEIVKQDDPAIALVFLDLHSKGLAKADANFDYWFSFMNESSLCNEFWLLAYEANIKGWLSTPNDYISGNTFFSLLREKGISFYDTNKLFTLSDIDDEKEFDRIQAESDDEDLTSDISPAH